MPYKRSLTAYRQRSPRNGRKPFVKHSLVGCLVASLLYFAGGQAAETLELTLGSESYQVELAMSAAQRQQGLMFRRQLACRQGMLLVYQQPGDYRIWMKNMLIPLRVYWIDANFNVIGVRRLEPCEYSPCPVYSVDQPSLYILELADYDHPLGLGDRLAGIRID